MIENGVETWEGMTLMRSQWLIFGNILLSFCSAALRFPSVFRKRNITLCSCASCRVEVLEVGSNAPSPLLKTKGLQKWLSRVMLCIAEGWKSLGLCLWRLPFPPATFFLLPSLPAFLPNSSVHATPRWRINRLSLNHPLVLKLKESKHALSFQK